MADSSPLRSTLIEFKNVLKGYESLPALFSNCSFQIQSGDFFYLAGVSGSGKSTLLKMMILLEKPQKGNILFGGTEILKYSAKQCYQHRREVGMVFQDYCLLEKETVLANIMLPMRIHGINTKKGRERALKLLEEVGMSNRQKEKVMHLSGGEKQLIAIARAMALKPSILLADEPTGNLDQAMAFWILELLRNINRNGTTVIIATHDLHLMRAFPNRTLLIKDRSINEVAMN